MQEDELILQSANYTKTFSKDFIFFYKRFKKSGSYLTNAFSKISTTTTNPKFTKQTLYSSPVSVFPAIFSQDLFSV